MSASQSATRRPDTNVAATFRSANSATSSKDAASAAWRRKSHRLEAARYVGASAYSLTLATDGRAKYFTVAKTVEWCLEELQRAAIASGFVVEAYVFMPDHLHLLVAGASETAVLPAFVKAFKQRTAFWFKQREQKSLWQKGYWDHILRQDEDFVFVTGYLASNPLHAGLADDWQTYRFWGGRLLKALANEGGTLIPDEPSGADLKVAATAVNEIKDPQ